MNSRISPQSRIGSPPFAPLAQQLCRRAGFWALPGLVAALAIGHLPTQAAVTEAWVQHSPTPTNTSADVASKVINDAAGNVIVAGYAYRDGFAGQANLILIKYSGTTGSVLWRSASVAKFSPGEATLRLTVDGGGNILVGDFSSSPSNHYHTAKYAAADGHLIWERRYYGAVGGDDASYALAVDAAGDVVMTGTSMTNPFDDGDFYTAKYASADGALLWEKNLDGGQSEQDEVKAMALDGSGNVIVTGYIKQQYLNIDNTHRVAYTAKYAGATGSFLWEIRPARCDCGAGAENYAVAVDSNGDVVVGGFSSFFNTNYYSTTKYAGTNGALLWEKRYNGPTVQYDDAAPAVAVDGARNVIVTIPSWNGTNADIYTAKYAGTNGALLWEKRYNSPANGDDEASTLVLDGSGNAIVRGYSWNGTDYDDYTAKYAAANGALLWEKHSDTDTAVAVDSTGNVILVGSVFSAATGWDLYAGKYAGTNGTLLWEQSCDGAPQINAGASAVAFDAGGNVIVTGRAGNGTNDDYFTAKYAVNGTLLWEKRYNGPANENDYATALAVDGSGNVVVTGQSEYNYSYTAKYAAADGVLLWEKRSTADFRFPTALAVDGSGNAVVAGNSLLDGYTAKYAAADGALLWETFVLGPDSDNLAGVNAVAVDASGNVMVTGYVVDGENRTSALTIKYAAADGALLWNQRYNGPANSNDVASAVAVDASGDVIVTGTSHNGTNEDYYTAKYAAATGALLWEKRYNGPANGNDVVGSRRCLALGPNGMVAITGSSQGSFGSDFATVVYRENLPAVSIVRFPTGVRLRFPGVAGHSYQLLRAPAVTGPWSTNATLTAATNGLIEYLDTNAVPGSAFYRTAVTP